MPTVYEGLIRDLKDKLKSKNIKFNKIFSLIDTQEYTKINEMIEDGPTQILIQKIVTERKTIFNNMEIKLTNLLTNLSSLNDLLIKFGEEPQPSKTKARKLLKKKVFINLFDLESEQYDKRTTLQNLKKDSRKNRHRRFSLSDAKEHPKLKMFLIKV